MFDYLAKHKVPFHTPGHKGGRGIASVLRNTDWARLDLTEVPELDDLHQPQGIIAAAQSNCAKCLNSDASFFLVNGASVGVQAALLATVAPGDKVLVPRNSHKSVISALILTGAQPIYYQPQVHPEFGLPLGQNISEVIQQLSPQVKAVVALYPSYFGTVWDLAQFRAQWQGLLIVDEAHGAHFPFSPSLPPSALDLGADIIIQSTHKTLGALTQGAMLHLGSGSSVPKAAIGQALDILHTTSPSYLLLASLEAALWEAKEHGRCKWAELTEGAIQLKDKLIKRGIRVLNRSDIGTYGIVGLDESKILIHVSDGYKVAQELAEHYGIQPELYDSHNVLFLLGVGDSFESFSSLENALLNITVPAYTTIVNHSLPELPSQIMTPREAYFALKDTVSLKQSIGRICGETLAPYPPGIPIIVPGELITQEVVSFIERFRNFQWQGNTDPGMFNITVIKER